MCPLRAENQPQLHDQTGAAFSLADARHRPVVLTFVAAHCVDACPIINAQYEQVQTQLRRARVPVHLVTLTLDPEHDRAADMRRIARTFHADPQYWSVGMAGVPQIRALMRRFHVVATRGHKNYDDIHTTYVYLLDSHGRVIKTILASTNMPADLFAELQRTWNKLTG